MTPKRKRPEPNTTIRRYSVDICDGCYNLIGESCNTPGCAFIRCSTAEIRELLNQTQLQPLVDGKPVYKLPGRKIRP